MFGPGQRRFLLRGRERQDALIRYRLHVPRRRRRFSHQVLAAAAPSASGLLGAGELRQPVHVVVARSVAGVHGRVARARGFRPDGQEAAARRGQEVVYGGDGRPHDHRGRA